MNILVTTFGKSWQMVAELFGFTNPDEYDFFHGNREAKRVRESQQIEPVDELWLITTENNNESLSKSESWADGIHIRSKLKYIICTGVSEFHSEYEIILMRSCIYAAVAAARHATENGKLYLSLAGGRKTMSADMQDAGYLFGCDAMLHMVDVFTDKTLQNQFNTDALLKPTEEYAQCFLPILINEKTQTNHILQHEKITHPHIEFNAKNKCEFHDEGRFAQVIQDLKNKSSQLYANYITSLMNYNNERQIFYKLNFLPPHKINVLKQKTIAQNKKTYKNDIALLKKLPKADLHSHLGGVLSAEEIIEVACAVLASTDYTVTVCFGLKIQRLVNEKDMLALEEEKNALFALKQKDFKQFYTRLLYFISAFKHKPALFDKLIFGEYICPDKFYHIGLEAYQQLGDFQGSSLLQTEVAIQKTLELYAKKLQDDNVRYVELRCSPYKYTRLGLSAESVTRIIIKAFDKYAHNICYRLIMIVARDASPDEVKKSIDEIITLHTIFGEKIAGIDLAGTECGNPPEQLREAFLPLLEKCLSITIHAGETESVDSIWQAVYHLSAERIGHGLRLNDKPELVKSFLDKNIGIEMCPSSNDQIVGFSRNEALSYPLKSYMEQGLKVTVNTDDCGISRTFLSREFYKAAELSLLHDKEGLRLWDCIILIRNSLSCAFVPKDEKAKLMRQFENEIFRLCEEESVL